MQGGIPSRTHGIVLAGGYGTRIGNPSSIKNNMFPVAKPALPVGNQPAMLGVLLAMREMGVDTVTIASKHVEHTIRRVIGDGSAFGLKVDYFDMERDGIEDWGTAWTVDRWLLKNRNQIGRLDTIIVLSGDTIWDRSISGNLIKAWQASNAWAQIAVCDSPWPDIFGSYGIVQPVDHYLSQAYARYMEDCRQACGEPDAVTQARINYTKAINQALVPHRGNSLPIINFVEKPGEGEFEKHVSNLGNASIYVFLAEVFNYYRLHPTSVNKTLGRGFADFGYKMFQEGFVADRIPFEAFITPQDWYWLDIGTPKKLLQANFDIMSGRYLDGTLGYELRPGIWLGQNVRASEKALAALTGPVVIGDSVTIEDDCQIGPNVVIGRGWVIRAGAKISSSVLFPPYYADRLDHIKIVKPGTIIENSILAGGEIEAGEPIVDMVVVVAPDKSLKFSSL